MIYRPRPNVKEIISLKSIKTNVIPLYIVGRMFLVEFRIKERLFNENVGNGLMVTWEAYRNTVVKSVREQTEMIHSKVYEFKVEKLIL